MLNKLLYIIPLLLLTACSSGVKHETKDVISPVRVDSVANKPTFSPLYYSKLDSEYKTLLSQMKTPDKSPELLQKDFQRWTRKRRKEFIQKQQLHKKNFQNLRKKTRAQFLDKMHNQRQKLKASSKDKESIAKLYRQQGLEKKEFYALDKEKSRHFRNNNSQEKTDFNDLMRERSKAFRDEFRIYKKNYANWVKSGKASLKKEPIFPVDEEVELQTTPKTNN